MEKDTYGRFPNQRFILVDRIRALCTDCGLSKRQNGWYQTYLLDRIKDDLLLDPVESLSNKPLDNNVVVWVDLDFKQITTFKKEYGVNLFMY